MPDSDFGSVLDLRGRPALRRVPPGPDMRIDTVVSGEIVGRLGAVLLLTRPDGSILDANQAALDCYEYTHAEMLELTMRDIQASQFQATAEMWEREIPERSFEYHDQHRRSGGDTFPCEVRVTSVRAGGETALLASVRDITDRMRTEAELETRDRWLNESQRIARLGHCIFNLQTDRWFGSTALYDILGVDRDSSANFAGWIGLAHSEERDMLSRYYAEEVLGLGLPLDIEYRIVRPCDGAERWVHAMGSAEFHADGRPLEMFCIVQDITERRRSEESLRVYAELLESSPASITVHTTQGQYLYANEHTAEMHGYSREEFMALTLQEVDVPDSAALIDERVRHIAERGHDSFEVAHFRKDGSILPLDVNSRLALWDGRTVLLSVATDITERKNVEQSLLDTNSRLESMVYAVAGAMGRVVEVRDPYTRGHETRTADFAKLLATEMGLSAEEIAGVEMAALVHDIGKLSVPSDILNKPGVLSANEMALIREHPTTGHDILRDIPFPWPVADAVLQHHERLDGSGYPRGLQGDEISLCARILAVADVIEAMASHRPYRPALGANAAVAEVLSHPEQYDEEVLAACVRLHESGRIAW